MSLINSYAYGIIKVEQVKVQFLFICLLYEICREHIHVKVLVIDFVSTSKFSMMLLGGGA